MILEGRYIGYGRLEGRKINKPLLSFLILLTVFLSLFRFWQSTGCRSYLGKSDLMQSTILDVESQRIYDSNLFGAKVFHNKVIAAPKVFVLEYTKYFEPKFLLDLVGPLGVFMSLVALSNVVKKKSKLGYFNFFIILLVVLCTWAIKAFLVFPLFVLSLASFSLFSIPTIIKRKQYLVLYFFLWVFTLWFFFVNWRLTSICNEILFK